LLFSAHQHSSIPARPGSFLKVLKTPTTAAASSLSTTTKTGLFTDVTERIGIHTTGWTLDLATATPINDGFGRPATWPNDFGTDRFYVNNGNGTFTDKTESAIGFRH